MFRILAAAIPAGLISLSLTATPVQADGKRVVVDLPNLSGMPDEDAEKLIAALAQINVITSHCPDYPISDGEWTLLVGTGDMLARQLGMDPASYDKNYYGPAFQMLDDPAACDRIGPKARPIIEDLISMGGGTEHVAE
ncbi:MAG: hypothetical protein ACK5II_01440 [Paracoccus sp. (in: a-proteobacteria)]